MVHELATGLPGRVLYLNDLGGGILVSGGQVGLDNAMISDSLLLGLNSTERFDASFNA